MSNDAVPLVSNVSMMTGSMAGSCCYLYGELELGLHPVTSGEQVEKGRKRGDG